MRGNRNRRAGEPHGIWFTLRVLQPVRKQYSESEKSKHVVSEGIFQTSNINLRVSVWRLGAKVWRSSATPRQMKRHRIGKIRWRFMFTQTVCKQLGNILVRLNACPGVTRYLPDEIRFFRDDIWHQKPMSMGLVNLQSLVQEFRGGY